MPRKTLKLPKKIKPANQLESAGKLKDYRMNRFNEAKPSQNAGNL